MGKQLVTLSIFILVFIFSNKGRGVDDGKYQLIENESSYEWKDLGESSAVQDPRDDQVIGPINLGFVFRYYDRFYNTLYISTNGFILFEEPLEAGCCHPQHIPLLPGESNLNGIISFGWSDLNPTIGGEIRWKVFGIYPQREIVIEFNKVAHQGRWDAWPLTAQIVLYEFDGRIKFNYKEDGDYPFPVLIGIDEPGEGTGGIEYFYGGLNNIELENKALEFIPIGNIRIIPESINYIGEGEVSQFKVRIYQSSPNQSYTILWDSNGDGEYDLRDVTQIQIDATTIDGPSIMPLKIHVEDDIGNGDELNVNIFVSNLPPQIISSPPENVTPGSIFTYKVEAIDPAQSLDPIKIGIIRGPKGMTVNDNVIRWNVPEDSEPGDSWQVLLIAYDDDGGFTRQYFQITVVEEEKLPKAPQIVYPSKTIVPIPQPELIVENVETEGNAFYYFVLDKSPNFNTEELIESGAIPPGQGQRTKWKVPIPLKTDTRYYWKVWVQDSMGIGPSSSTYFDVKLGEAIDSREEGCSCKINSSFPNLLFKLPNINIFYIMFKILHLGGVL